MKTYSVNGTILIDNELSIDVYATTDATDKKEAAEKILSMTVIIHEGDSGDWVTGPIVKEVI